MKQGLARVAALYAKVERLRGLELRVALAEVDAVDEARTATLAERRDFAVQSREALSAGDRAGMACAEWMVEAAGARVERLDELRVVREEAAAKALVAHRESRLETEQMVQVVDALRREQALVEGRREQAAADDRYGARTAWLKDEKRRMK